MYFVASQNASHTSQDHTWELRCMNHWSSMVADVGVFQVAEVPTNWHECSIPKLFTFGTSFHSHYRIRKLNFWNFFFKTFSFPNIFFLSTYFPPREKVKVVASTLPSKSSNSTGQMCYHTLAVATEDIQSVLEEQTHSWAYTGLVMARPTKV